ncbi:hypothetical protein AY601_5048 [Pedobacter cryoconitis]|uniref:ATPase n=1 Tax=Pedobacter cryoconitis TaxID=188932 RepID=A0A127VL03_9SPHI|nr:hypothetical protein [Pedobacter cryoconitis]AMQ01861.1 hypothetical protein AY601_5048 [Pedobacter cryoconitis]
MGIFEKNKSLPSNDTKGFYFGSPEAEGENINGYKLIDYFEDYLDILDNLQRGKFIFSGRKGVGKSAIAKFIKDKSDLTNDSFATILRISDFDIQKSIQHTLDEKRNEMLLFEWLILINIVKLIVKNHHSQYTMAYSKLQKFLENNSGIIDVDKFQIDEGFKKSGGEVSFGVLTHAFGGVFKKYFDVKVTKAPFFKIIDPLKDIVKLILDYPVNRELEFWLLFDDLDINYDIKNDYDNQKIIELLRLAKYYNNNIFLNNKAKILVFIRDDIRGNLISKFPDSAKIFASYEIVINWYNHYASSLDENNNPLKKLVNKRIEINFKNHNIKFSNDPWNSLFKNDNVLKSSFKSVLDFTFYRPRDVITFLSVLSNEKYPFPISSINLKRILEKYININLAEIKSELSLHFNEREKDIIFRLLFPFIIENQGLKYDLILMKISELNFDMEPNKVVDILLSYSLIVYQNRNGDLYFNYREDTELERMDKDDLSLTLPKCIYHHYRRIN